MRRFISLLSIVALVLAVGLLFTISTDAYAQQAGKGKPANKGFVDANNDGVNDNARDADGDGIPNGQDPDYVKLNPNAGRGHGFVDADGDGINDYAQDADGDGIPNGQDPDWVPPMDGSGQKKAYRKAAHMGAKAMRGHAVRSGFMGFIDEDGDGINDRMQDADGDGIPNGKDPDYARPQDGSGRKFGPGSSMGRPGAAPFGTGTGVCDGTGPKGSRHGGRRN